MLRRPAEVMRISRRLSVIRPTAGLWPPSMFCYCARSYTSGPSNDRPGLSSEHLKTTPVYDPARNPETKHILLRTLYRPQLAPEDYLDLSDTRGILLDPLQRQASSLSESELAPFITYGRNVQILSGVRRQLITYTPFPVNTRGFLYFHRHTAIPLACSVRFRIAQEPTRQGFSQGQDLLNPNGTPWNIPLIALATSSRYKVLQDLLIQDRLVPQELVDRCEELVRKLPLDVSVGPWSQFIFTHGQPFFIRLAKRDSMVFLVGMNGLYKFRFDEMLPPNYQPFRSGAILCQFELSQGAGRRHSLLRVLRVVEPVKFAPGYRGPIDMPQPNQFITFRGEPRAFLTRRVNDGTTYHTLWTRDHKSQAWAWNWRAFGDMFKDHWGSPAIQNSSAS